MNLFYSLCHVFWFGPGRQQKATRSLCCLSPRWDGEENGKRMAKLMGSGKGSLTEQQRNSNYNTDRKNMQNKQQKCTEQLSPPDAQRD